MVQRSVFPKPPPGMPFLASNLAHQEDFRSLRYPTSGNRENSLTAKMKRLKEMEAPDKNNWHLVEFDRCHNRLVIERTTMYRKAICGASLILKGSRMTVRCGAWTRSAING